MSHWNYRVTREKVTNPDDTEAWFYALREVHYDDDGKVVGWTEDPVNFAADSPGEVIESLLMATKAWPHDGVLDLATRETVRTTYNGSEVESR